MWHRIFTRISIRWALPSWLGARAENGVPSPQIFHLNHCLQQKSWVRPWRGCTELGGGRRRDSLTLFRRLLTANDNDVLRRWIATIETLGDARDTVAKLAAVSKQASEQFV